MDVSAIVLSKLLAEQDIESWAKLKLCYIDPAYTTLYSAISRHYDKYSTIPSYDELKATLREGPTLKTLASIELVLDADIDMQVAIDALIDQYTQAETIRLLDKFIDKLPIYDTDEVKENLSAIVVALDEKTLKTSNVFSQNDIMVFRRPDEIAKDRTPLGLNNTFDSVLAGVAREELILIGGKRGAGKSIVCSNLMVNQYEMGNTSAYFTIEMIAQETNERNLAILADVNYQHLKQGKLSDSEIIKLVQVRADMYVDAQDLVQEFLKHRDQYKFEETLVKSRSLKPDNQMIIIDDRALTLSSLDLHLGKIKAKFGAKFKLGIIDYLNQIEVEKSSGQFDWQPQIGISKQLKSMARKHGIALVSPYQIDDSGVARFAKGILDAPDIALILEAHEKATKAVSFNTTKIRGAGEMGFTSAINWDTLRISPVPIDRPKDTESEAPKDTLKRAGKKKKSDDTPTGEPATDAPW